MKGSFRIESIEPLKPRSDRLIYITISGGSFSTTQNILCRFDDNAPLNANYVNTTIASCTTPYTDEDHSKLRISNNNGHRWTNKFKFDYGSPTIYNINPPITSQRLENITIHGSFDFMGKKKKRDDLF